MWRMGSSVSVVAVKALMKMRARMQKKEIGGISAWLTKPFSQRGKYVRIVYFSAEISSTSMRL